MRGHNGAQILEKKRISPKKKFLKTRRLAQIGPDSFGFKMV